MYMENNGEELDTHIYVVAIDVAQGGFYRVVIQHDSWVIIYQTHSSKQINIHQSAK